MIETIRERITEYSWCISMEDTHLQESDSNLGSPKPQVSLYDDFEPSYFVRPIFNNDMPLPSLKQERSLPVHHFEWLLWVSSGWRPWEC